MGQSESIQVFVKTPYRRTLTLELERRTTVEDIKARITVEEGIDPSEQRLFFNNKELQDDYYISMYDIQDKSTLQLMVVSRPRAPPAKLKPLSSWKINVAMEATGERITMNVTGSTTIKEIKNEIIYASTSTRALYKEHLHLEFNDMGHELQDGASLLHYGIEPGSTLLARETKVSVTIKTPSETTFNLSVTPSMTVETIKVMIHECKGIPIEVQQLKINHGELDDGRELDNGQRLSYYGIGNGSLLHLTMRQKCICVQTSTGEQMYVPYGRLATCTIRNIKDEIQAMTGIPPAVQQLFYNNILLGVDEQTLSDYNIEFKGTLDMFLKPENGLAVYVKTKTHKTIFLDVAPSDTIQSVKAKIQEKEGTPSQQQTLTFDGIHLPDHNCSLSHYGITNQSSINLLNEWIQVKAPSGGMVGVSCVDGSTTIGEVKSRIRDVIREPLVIPPDKRQLVLRSDSGHPLNDDCVCDSSSHYTCEYIQHHEMLIVVKLSRGGTLFHTVTVTPSTRVHEMKGMIEGLTPPVGGYHLMFNGKELEDSQTVADCLQHRYVQHPEFELLLPVSFLLPSGKTKQVAVFPSELVKKLKSVLYSPQSNWIDMSLVHLTYAGIQLEDSHALSQYNIPPDSTLIVQESNMSITIHSGTTKDVAMPVTPSTTVMELKSAIQRQVAIPADEQRLYFLDRSVELKNTVSVSDYHIKTGDQLTLVFSVSVSVEVPTGDILHMKAFTVRDLKEKIEQQLNIPQDRQDLFYHGLQLCDDSMLLSEHIQGGCKLYLADKESELNITVKTGTGRSLDLNVLPSTTVANIILKVSEHEGTDYSKHQLTFEGRALEDDQTLFDCKVQQKFETRPCLALLYGEIPLKVCLQDGSSMLMVTAVDSTISDIKNRLCQEESASVPQPEDFCLISQGTELEDHNTLKHYNIQWNRNMQPMPQVWIKTKASCNTHTHAVIETLSGKSFTVTSEPSDTIFSVKQKIEIVEGIPPNQQELSLNGLTLQDTFSLSNYSIKKGDTVRLNLSVRLMQKQSGAFINLNVQTMSGKTVVVRLRESDSVFYAKRKIQNEMEFPPDKHVRKLLLDGKEMSDFLPLSQYHINSQSKLTPVIGPKGNSQTIYIETAPGKTFTLDVDLSCTVGSIKESLSQDLQNASIIPVLQGQLQFSYAGRELNDNNTLSHYNIEDGSTLYLFCALLLYVKVPSGDTLPVSLKATSSTTIKDVKHTLKESYPDRQLHLKQQQFVFEGQPLRDELTLIEARVTNESTLLLVNLDGVREEIHHLAAIDVAMQRRGTLDFNLIHGVLIGVPRSGKSSLMIRLLGETLPSTSPSTGAMEKAIQVEVRKSSATAASVEMPPDSLVPIWTRISFDQEAIRLMIMASHGIETEPLLVYEPYSLPAQEHPVQPPEHQLLQEPIQSATVAQQSFSVPASVQQRKTEIRKPLPSGYLSPLEIFKGALRMKGLEAIREKLESSSLLYLTDTGGQIEFQELLCLLVSGPSLFFIVFRLDQDLDKTFTVQYLHVDRGNTKPYKSTMTVKEALLQSLASIAAMRNEVFKGAFLKNDIALKPKVIFVGTHKDLVDANQIAKVDRQLQDMVKSTTLYREDLVVFASEDQLAYTVNNLSSDDSDFRKIRSAVDYVGSHGEFKMVSPAHWLIYSLVVRHLDSRIVSFDEALQVAKECGIGSREELDEALWFLHTKMGVLRHFAEEDLHDLVILDPQVLFDKVTELIVDTFTFENVRSVRVLSDFKKRGIFPVDIFQQVGSSKDKLLTPTRLVNLLQHMRIIAPYQTQKEPHQYFIPCVLAHTEDAPTSQEPPSTDIPPLLFMFKCGYIPKGLTGSLIVYLLRNEMKAEFEWELEPDTIFKNQLSFRVGIYNDIVSIRIEPTHLAISCTSGMPSGQSKSHQFNYVCTVVRKSVQKGVEQVTQDLPYTSDADHSITFYCPAMECNSDPHPAKVHLDQEGVPCGVIWCDRVKRSVDLPTGYAKWFAQISPRVQHRSASSSHVQMEELRTCDKPRLYELQCLRRSGQSIRIIKHVAAKWKDLAVALHFESCTIEEIQKSEHFQPQDCCQKMFGRWLEGGGDQPSTWGRLIRALEDIELSELAESIQLVVADSMHRV